MHTGLLEPGADGHLTSGLHHGGGGAEPLRPEGRVAHAAAIRPEVADALAERRARKRDEAAIQRWRTARWPHTKNARRAGRSLVFWDETGFMLQPVCRRTWAPRGQTPLLRQWDRRDQLSAISALTVAPRRRRYGLYWALQRQNIRSAAVLHFLRALRRHLPHGFTLIWDRHRPHRVACVTTWLARQPRIVVEWLPAYAPELNPVEAVWSHTKYGDLANFAPGNLGHLEGSVLEALTAARGERTLLAGFIRAAGLEL